MTCPRCEGTGWVCEEHILRPWSSPNACGCGAAGAPCGRFNPSTWDKPPRLPKGFEPDDGDDGRGH